MLRGAALIALDDGRAELGEPPAPLKPGLLLKLRSAAAELIRRKGVGAGSRLIDWAAAEAPVVRRETLRGQALIKAGELEAALDVFEALVHGERRDFTHANFFANLAVQGADRARAIAAFEHAISIAKGDAARAATRLNMVEYLLSIGEGEHAAGQLALTETAALDPDWRLPHAWLDWALSGFAPRSAHQDALFAPDEVLHEGSIFHYRHGEGRCAVMFAPLHLRNLGLWKSLFLPVFRRAGVSVIAIADPAGLASLAGFGPSFGDRAASADALNTILAERGYHQTAGFGASLAGYAALHYSDRIGFQGVLGLSALTFIPDDPAELEEHAYVPLLRRIQREHPEVISNLRGRLSDNPEMVLHLHYGDRSALDRDQARNVADLANARCFALPDAPHGAIPDLRRSGRIDSVIEDFLAAIDWR